MSEPKTNNARRLAKLLAYDQEIRLYVDAKEGEETHFAVKRYMIAKDREARLYTNAKDSETTRDALVRMRDLAACRLSVDVEMARQRLGATPGETILSIAHRVDDAVRALPNAVLDQPRDESTIKCIERKVREARFRNETSVRGAVDEAIRKRVVAQPDRSTYEAVDDAMKEFDLLRQEVDKIRSILNAGVGEYTVAAATRIARHVAGVLDAAIATIKHHRNAPERAIAELLGVIVLERIGRRTAESRPEAVLEAALAPAWKNEMRALLEGHRIGQCTTLDVIAKLKSMTS